MSLQLVSAVRALERRTQAAEDRIGALERQLDQLINAHNKAAEDRSERARKAWATRRANQEIIDGD
jgi:predicted  nucleic acid-binding Zn-ribbon protein